MDRFHLRQAWNFDTVVESQRYQHILDAVSHHLGSDRWGDVLEVGCAEGLFTFRLAPHCSSLMACDISAVACAQAVQRCAQYPQVNICQFDLAQDNVPGRYSVVLVMDVLEMIHGRQRLRNVVTKLVDSLDDNGLLVYSGCRLQNEIRSRWYFRSLLEDATNFLVFLDDGFGLRQVYKEAYPPDGQSIPGYLDHMIALFVKPPNGGKSCRLDS